MIVVRGGRRIATTAVLILASMAFSPAPASADSSSPLLAAYYDRQMAIVGGAVYAWEGDETPARLPVEAVQVGVGAERYFVLTAAGKLQSFGTDPKRRQTLMTRVLRFAAGQSGVLAIDRNGLLWWIASDRGMRRKIAEGVTAAAVGDGANYYITKSGALFVKGKAHRGQYGDGKLSSTAHFVQTASGSHQISAHTGHAILLKRNGDVMGTGGNIYGPVGRHGIGDKAVRWSTIIREARAIATGSSHSLAIRRDGTLMAWGRGYDLEPVRVMRNVTAVAAGSRTTIALKTDGTLWQWDRGDKPRRIRLQ